MKLMNKHSEIILAGTGGQGLILSGIILAEDEMSEEAAKKYETWAARGVPMLYDSTLATTRSGENFIGRDFTRRASDLGNAGSVNILALAAVAAFTRVVTIASLESLLRKRFRGAALDLNLKLLACLLYTSDAADE